MSLMKEQFGLPGEHALETNIEEPSVEEFEPRPARYILDAAGHGSDS
jgi:hypothetical protein